MRNRGAIWVALAVVLALAAGMSAMLGGGEATRVLVASESLSSGDDIMTAVADGRLAFREVSGLDGIAGLIDEQNDLAGARLAVPVGVGEPITAAVLGGLDRQLPRVGPSERLVSIPLTSVGAVTAAVAPGTEVDVVASALEGPSTASRVVAERAAVVAVEDRVEALERGAGGVVIRVTDHEALGVTEALATGRDLRVIVRPPARPERP